MIQESEPVPTIPRNVGETMLLPIFIILMILAPVLVPAVITAAHHLTGRRAPAPKTRGLGIR
ncbi:hypothetical protein [Mycobacterium sp.]|uniref:hypothetical protein n=1 Tax=Mycobacterium sp. TaxID=1785 RepID=UPI003C78134A